MAALRLVFDGDSYRYEEPGDGLRGAVAGLEHRPGTPREIDGVPTSGEHRGKVAPGIYEIKDGPTHRVCFAPPWSSISHESTPRRGVPAPM